jgi:hypothetical protein
VSRVSLPLHAPPAPAHTADVNNRVYSTLDLSFDKTFWSRGNYPSYYVNGTETLPITNPWFSSSNNAAPFDQSFYLILNVAVGGTNGFFQDNVGGKPWLDSSLNAMGGELREVRCSVSPREGSCWC